jgi:hypothetical protein
MRPGRDYFSAPGRRETAATIDRCLAFRQGIGRRLLPVIATESAQLTASDVYQTVVYRPISRYKVAGRYLNLTSLAAQEDVR